MPRAGGLVNVTLEGTDVFKGTIDEIQSTGARGQDRILTVSARGFDSRSKINAPLDFHRDNVTLQAFLNDAVARAGLAPVLVDPAFASITRDYWSADSEGFLHLTERLASELGATFKVRGDQPSMRSTARALLPTASHSRVSRPPGGKPDFVDIMPYVGRPRGRKSKVKYFDKAAAAHKHVEVEIDPGAVDSAATPPYTAADAATSVGIPGGKKRDSQRGSVQLTLTPQARVERPILIKGARPGIDGAYRITSITHRLERSGGSTTDLELKQPAAAPARIRLRQPLIRKGSSAARRSKRAPGTRRLDLEGTVADAGDHPRTATSKAIARLGFG